MASSWSRAAHWLVSAGALLSLSCIQTAPRTAEAKRPQAPPFTFVFPELLRDPKDDVRDLVRDALEQLDESLGGSVLLVEPLSEPMACWAGQRAIPHALCHTEAQEKLRASGNDALIWGYVLNPKAEVFTLFAAARGGQRSEPLQPSGPEGMLTRRDFLGWFHSTVLARINRDSTALQKTVALRDRLFSLAAEQPSGPERRLWLADLALFAGDLSLALSIDGTIPAHVPLARSAYTRALELYSQSDHPRAWQSARWGLGTALTLAGERNRDESLLLQAVRIFEALLAADDPSMSPLGQPAHAFACRAASGATRLSVRHSKLARATCERAIQAIAPASPASPASRWSPRCSTVEEALLRADFGEVLVVHASATRDVELLSRAPAELACARKHAGLPEARRRGVTERLAQAHSELGRWKRQAPQLQQAAALYRGLLQHSNAQRASTLHLGLAQTLAFLGRLQPTATTLTEAVQHFELGSHDIKSNLSPGVQQAAACARLQLALLSSSQDLLDRSRTELLELSRVLEFRSQPELWLDNALLLGVEAWQRGAATEVNLNEALARVLLSQQRATTLFPDHEQSAKVLSELLLLRVAMASKNSERVCLQVTPARAFLASSTPPSASPGLWPSPTSLDLAREVDDAEAKHCSRR